MYFLDTSAQVCARNIKLLESVLGVGLSLVQFNHFLTYKNFSLLEIKVTQILFLQTKAHFT